MVQFSDIYSQFIISEVQVINSCTVCIISSQSIHTYIRIVIHKADLHDTIFAYDHHMRLLLFALLAGLGDFQQPLKGISAIETS